MNSNFKYVFKNSIYMFLLKILGAVVTFGFTMQLTRQLGAEESGYYFYVISLLALLASFSSLGFNSSILKITSIMKDSSIIKSKLFDISLICILFSIVISLILWFGFTYVLKVDEYYFFALICLIPFVLSQIFSSYYQSVGQTFLSSIYLNLFYQIVLLSYLFFFEITEIEQVFNVLSISLYFSVAVFLIMNLIKFRGGTYRFSGRVEIKKMLLLSLPMMLAQIISQINNFSGQFLMNIYATSTDISLYSVAMRVAVLISFISSAVSRVSASKFATLYENNQMEELKLLVLKSNKMLFLMSFPMFLFVVLFGELILSFFGPEFVEAYYILVLLSAGQFISSICGSVFYLLQMTGNEKEMMLIIIISTCASIILGFILVPIYGMYGAAIMTFVTLLLNCLISCYKAYKNIGFNPLNIFVK
jgi:O-antigen/teichoic acid export membrane protein